MKAGEMSAVLYALLEQKRFHDFESYEVVLSLYVISFLDHCWNKYERELETNVQNIQSVLVSTNDFVAKFEDIMSPVTLKLLLSCKFQLLLLLQDELVWDVIEVGFFSAI